MAAALETAVAGKPEAGRAPTSPGLQGAAGIDLPAFIERCMGDTRLAKSLSLMFAGRAQLELAAARHEASENNRESLLRRVHSLRGAAASVAAVEVAETAGQLERKLCDNCTEAVQEDLERLRIAVERYVRELPDLLQRLPDDPGSWSEKLGPLCAS